MNEDQLLDIEVGDILGVVHEEEDTMAPELVIVIGLSEPPYDYYISEWEVQSYDNPDDKFWVDTSRIRYNCGDKLTEMVDI